jgi:Fe-S cluster assembly protein SufD
MNVAIRDHYLAEFARLADVLPGHNVPWFQRARQVALENFAETGFPTLRDEDWKYTSVAAIEKRPFRMALRGETTVRTDAVDAAGLGDDCFLMVFVNGHHVPELSRLGGMPDGVTVASFAESVDHQPALLQAALASEPATSGFAQLNTAFAADGAFIRVARNVMVGAPIELLFVSTGADRVSHLRNLVWAEEGSEATIVEHYVGLADSACLTNAVTQIFSDPNSSVEHYRFQEESAKSFHVGGIHAQQKRDSRLASHSLSLGAALARHDIGTRFDAEGCDATLNGLYIVDGRQHVDHHTRIDHAQPHGTSREFYRGILDGNARGVFNGRVIVRQDAQHTDAHQVNNNLLLSRDAEVDTKPQLEIYADDVKCAHGATVGQLDDDQIFYLRSRGIAAGAARSLLTYAFANDIINRVRVGPLRARLQQIMLDRLPQAEVIRELV